IFWTALSLILLAACVSPISRHGRIAPVDLAALILASSSGFLTLVYGQVTFLLMVLFTAAWCADRRGDATMAGALLVGRSVLKAFCGLVGVYVWRRRQWQSLAAYATVFLAGTLGGWAIAGTSAFFGWVSSLQDVQWRWHIYNASVWGVSDRLLTMHSNSELW